MTCQSPKAILNQPAITMQKDGLRNADLVTGIVLVIISVYFLIESLGIPWGEIGGIKGGIYISPGLFPVVISIGLLLMSLRLITFALKEGAHLRWMNRGFFRRIVERKEFYPIITVIGLLVAYAFLLLGRMPYLVATFIFLLSFMWIFKGSRFYKLIIIAAAVSWFVSFIFKTWVRIPLP